ncbi:hypothetical protein Tco_0212104 [Tanacetum coccineum]
MDAVTMKIDAQYKEFQSRSKQPNPDHNDDDKPMSPEEEAKFMQTFRRTRFYNDYRDRDSNRDNWRSIGRNDYNRDNYRSNSDDKPYDVQRQLSDFMKSQHSTNAFVKETFMDFKNQLEAITKNHQASIQNLKAKFDRFADKQSARPSGSLSTRNEHVNVVFTRSGKSYDPPINPNDQQRDSETPTNFDSEDEDEESTHQPKSKTLKPIKETLIPKPYKPKIPYPQHIRIEKMEAHYGKFLDMIRAVLNVPFVDVLAGMPNYGKFLKELVSNKHKLEQISSAFLRDENSAMIQNKVPPKLGDHESFLIPCTFSKAFSCNALADLAENMLVEVGKFTFLVDFVILKMEEDSKVPLILRRPFFHTADTVIRVKHQQLYLGVGTERMTFSIHSAMKHSYSNDDTCFSIDVIDEILEEDFDALLDEWSEILHSIEGTILEEKLFAKFNDFMEMTTDKNTNLNLMKKNQKPSFLPVIISSQLSEQNIRFDIEIKDKKGTKNVVADHLSRIDNDETIDDNDVDDNFPGETLMEITTNDTPWFVFSTWMAFGGNTRNLGSFGEETDEITNLHQILEEVLLIERGDGVASIKRRRHDLSGDGVWILTTTSQCSQLKVDIEPST